MHLWLINVLKMTIFYQSPSKWTIFYSLAFFEGCAFYYFLLSNKYMFHYFRFLQCRWGKSCWQSSRTAAKWKCRDWSSNENGTTALHRYAQKAHVELVSLLLKHKADMDALTKFDKATLLLASSYGESEIFKAFLKYGAHPNIQNDKENTRLHLTACYDHHETVNSLCIIKLVHLLKMMREIQPYN